MPTEPCLVTVRAGPAASKGYENFVANKLKDEVLKEITSNLQDDLKEEALKAFKDTVEDGWSIKDCICKVQNDVLPKVPNERNKFYIKFTYDNQLQIEIGVNKFKNGNAQFYHSIGVAPQETPEIKEHKEDRTKRKEVMEDLESVGRFPSIKLKKQVTNDKSSPFAEGKVSNPRGGWEDAPENEVNAPPNPTNMQTAMACTGWIFDPPCNTRSSRRRALGDLFKNEKPNASNLRCRSVGRPKRDRYEDNSPEVRNRSVSPFCPRGTGKGSPGECFTTGIIRSKARLRPAGSHTVHRGSFKTGRKFCITKENKENDTNNTLKHIEIQVEQEHCPYKDEDDKLNDNCSDIGDISSSEESIENEPIIQDKDKQKKSIFITEPTGKMAQPIEHDYKQIDTRFLEKYTLLNTTYDEFIEDEQSIEDEDVQKKSIFITESETEPTDKNVQPIELDFTQIDTQFEIQNVSTGETIEDKASGKHNNHWFITKHETDQTYKKSHQCEPECQIKNIPFKEEYPIQSIKKFHLPDQSLFKQKIKPLPPLEE